MVLAQEPRIQWELSFWFIPNKRQWQKILNNVKTLHFTKLKVQEIFQKVSLRNILGITVPFFSFLPYSFTIHLMLTTNMIYNEIFIWNSSRKSYWAMTYLALWSFGLQNLFKKIYEFPLSYYFLFFIFRLYYEIEFLSHICISNK